MRKGLIIIALLLSSFCFYEARATHIVGGEVTYKYMGDSVSIFPRGSFALYEVSLSIYEDCQNGVPEAIASDNPAYLAVYEGGGSFNFVRADSVQFASSVAVPVNFNNACVTNVPATCLLKKTFIIRYAFKSNSFGYVINSQRCCRNNAVMNINNPGNTGSTYFCYIPPPPEHNNSAVFKNYPPQIICQNNPLFYDHSAYDADGDSLSYSFGPAFLGATDADIKPWPPARPPFDTVSYKGGYNSKHPFPGYPLIQIDPKTGLITGTPNSMGRYLVTVYCNEYRDGLLINTVTREFQFVVTSCSKVVVADVPMFSTEPNTYVVNCSDFNVHFVNNSKGGFAYHWDFGVLNSTTDVSTEKEPSFTYPDTGTYTVELLVNPGSTCPDSITRLVKVYPKFHAAFTDSGSKCPGSELKFIDQSSSTIKPIISWKWDFGDGDSTYDQNPKHTYIAGGIYNVILISENVRNCVDTVMKQIFVENFVPFAGDDTIIVKGEQVHFNATGGIQYTWLPPDHLSDTNIYNPVGYFPDTGHYTYFLHVVSPYGCEGNDTMSVRVVNQAAFLVPNAFTPDGDGVNDYFKPVSVGYRNLRYFRVFNRWGQNVYYTTELELGWDGTYKSKKADLGTYYWEISYTDRFGTTGFMKGDVILVK